MDKNIVMFKVEAFKRNVKMKVSNFWNRVKTFCVMYPGAAAIVGSALFRGLIVIVKDCRKDYRIKKENDARDSRIYDRRADQWFETRRPLTNREKAKLTERYNNGESKYEILKDMHLLW